MKAQLIEKVVNWLVNIALVLLLVAMAFLSHMAVAAEFVKEGDIWVLESDNVNKDCIEIFNMPRQGRVNGCGLPLAAWHIIIPTLRPGKNDYSYCVIKQHELAHTQGVEDERIAEALAVERCSRK